MEVSLLSRHFKRTCIQYNNKLRAQHLRPLLDTDCRIKTNVIKQIGPPPLAQRMRAGGAQLGLLGGLFNVPGEASRWNALHKQASAHMCRWPVCVGVGVWQGVGVEREGRDVCICAIFLPNIVQVSYGPGIDHKPTLWLSVKTRLQQL